MRKYSYLFFFLCTSFILRAQTPEGIHFEHLSWDQVLAKAKAENKYIFVDCYTTWCGPCKEMDKNIYPLKEVGDYFNSHFISVKVQMDKTDTDRDFIKSWYASADVLRSNYTINVFPTYLFLGPDGKAVHKATSLKTPDGFIAIGKDAIDSPKQYYSKVANFKPGTLDTSEMKGLTHAYKRSGIELSEKIIVDYLDRIPVSEKFNADNLKFLAEFYSSKKIQDIAFQYLNGLSKQEFGQKKNLDFAIVFCNGNQQVQELCMNYLKGLNEKEFSDTINLKFTSALNPLPIVQNMAVTYLENLKKKDLGKKQNLKFAAAFNQNPQVQEIANSYISGFIKEDLQEADLIKFMESFTKTSKDPGFMFFYKYSDQINALMSVKGFVKDFSQCITNNIIYKEEINPILTLANAQHTTVEWGKILNIISHKYDVNTAQKTILDAKVNWYRYKSDWPNYLNFAFEQINKYGIPDGLGGPNNVMNNFCWDAIFTHSSDIEQINMGIKWMETVLKNTSYKAPVYIDTYANLLYKSGRVQDALIWEKKALDLTFGGKGYQETTDKMLKGEPTWPVTNSFIQQHISKPVIDSRAIATWPRLIVGSISNNGLSISYSVNMGHATTLVIQSTTSSGKREFPDATGLCFSKDSKHFLFIKKDTLFSLSLTMGKLDKIIGISSKKTSGDHEWLAYQLKGSNDIILRNLITAKESTFQGINEYNFDKNDKVLLLKTSTNNGKDTVASLQWISLTDGNARTVYSSDGTNGSMIHSYCFDNDSQQLAFLVEQKEDGKKNNSIWYYRTGMEKAVLQIDNHSLGIEKGWFVSNSKIDFSKNGAYILFNLEKPDNRIPDPKVVKVDVWDYKEVTKLFDFASTIQSAPAPPLSGQAIACIETRKVIQPKLQEDENVYFGYGPLEDFGLISKPYDPRFQDLKRDENKSWIMSLKDGGRHYLGRGVLCLFSFSPDDHWLIYFNYTKKQYFSYDIQTGKVTSIFSASILKEGDDHYPSYGMLFCQEGTPVWMPNSSRLLVFDKYDIWLLDPSGIQPPISITNGYGRLHHIVFRLLERGKKNISDSDPLLLKAFDAENKKNGFYKITIGAKGNPEKLYMASCVLNAYEGILDGPIVQKAKDVDTWLVARQSATEAPNFFLSHDLKSFERLTDLQPQKKYNWFTTELVNFMQLDGKPSQGILYKPEDFDPHKKYPIIFYYYEKISWELNSFLNPNYTAANINIPWFVSRGYLVFTPDIYYTTGHPGGSAYNSVVAAAKYLSRLSYVDAKRMGIQGHSFGSTETNYIITNSHLFAAACSASGTSDMISAFGGFFMPGNAGLNPLDQGRMGVPPASGPQLYMKESPVLYANQVTTPLLMMYNRRDGFNYPQGVEFFTCLRRFNKRAWMLQYDEGGHTVAGIGAADFTKRLEQFFDHYLKAAAAPAWMTKGVPSKLKQIETGYELDPNGSCGADCPVCKELHAENDKNLRVDKQK